MGSCTIISCPGDKDLCVSWGLATVTRWVSAEGDAEKLVDETDYIAEHHKALEYWREQLGYRPSVKNILRIINSACPAFARDGLVFDLKRGD